MGFVSAVAQGIAKPAPKATPSSVPQAVAQGASHAAAAPPASFGQAVSQGASQGADQARAAAQKATQQLAQAIANVPDRNQTLRPQKLAFMNNIASYPQQVQALRDYLTKTGYVASAKSLGVQPLALLWGNLGKEDRQYLVSFMTSNRPIATRPDSLPLPPAQTQSANSLPAPKGWAPKPLTGKQYQLPLQLGGQPPNRGLV